MVGRGKIQNDAGLVWERPEPTRRPTPAPLSRERIVAAAVAIADEDGLSAVSLRKVGAALEAGPMRLYGYLSTKEELLDLMIDAIYGEIIADGPLRGSFRTRLRSIASRTRQAAVRHQWFIDLLGGRPHLGPNALAHLEAALGALRTAPGFEDIDFVMQSLRTVDAYVVGAIRREAAERASGMSRSEWQSMSGPYMTRMIATGNFPNLAKVYEDATHPSADVVFERGLELVLDGIAARLKR